MVSLDLCDTLELRPGDGLEVLDEIAWTGSGAPVMAEGAGDRPNLVERALDAVGRTALVRLHKAIPPGAGLGGGSSDAASVLRWAACSDLAVAAGLGADVPFCLAGGRALVTGIGEKLEPLAYEDDEILLVVPRLVVPTPAVYAAWDGLGGPEGDWGNDLEPAALAVEPRLAWWRDLVAATSGSRPRLAGSGGTWWLTGEHDELAELRDRLRAAVVGERESALVLVVRTLPAMS